MTAIILVLSAVIAIMLFPSSIKRQTKDREAKIQKKALRYGVDLVFKD